MLRDDTNFPDNSDTPNRVKNRSIATILRLNNYQSSHICIRCWIVPVSFSHHHDIKLYEHYKQGNYRQYISREI